MSLESVAQLVAVEFPAFPMKHANLRGHCQLEPRMANNSGYEAFFNDRDLRNAAYAASTMGRSLPIMRYMFNPTNRMPQKGFDIAMIAAMPGSGKTRLLDSLRSMPAPVGVNIVRIAVTFNGATSSSVLSWPLATRVAFAYFFGHHAHEDGNAPMASFDKHLVAFLGSDKRDHESLMLVLAAIAADQRQQCEPTSRTTM